MDQVITCGVFDPSMNLSYTVSFVYARNCMVARRELWSDLEEIYQYGAQRNHPWLILGDFNQILRAQDHYSLHPYPLPLVGMAEFQECIESCDLLELAGSGTNHTWYNNQEDNPITRKLDRCLINEAWLNLYPHSNVFYDAPCGSDHSPMLVSHSNDRQRRKVPLKFYNLFTSHPDYPSLIQNAWNGQDDIGSAMSRLC
ncbi:PREDICTED: uncharacterized protein LOC109127983 [Camelina sativa]|uniref:Uncharacterized protein LOC109127983 n=1 Tax=Camelina sativa TaxID=90675 RepID=A0ABM1QQZ1_CAMSA|nr:PREDICTED: uncharacterized protein LOC109127983 [Camelina sativa]